MSALPSFTIGEFTIRQHNGLFSLNDLHVASGGEDRHRPTYFLSNAQTKALVEEIELAGIPAITAKQKIGTYACRELVIAYAAWISPAFNLKVIRVFLAVAAPEQTTSHRPTTFHFDKNCIRVLTYHGKPWFVAKDLVPVLGYIDIMEMANHLRHDEHRSVLGYYSLSEFGLYSAIIESDSPDADRFQRWVTSKVIPVYQPKDQPPVPVPAVSKSVVVDKIEQHIHCIHKLSYDYVSAIGEEADIAYLANPKEIRYHERQLALLGVNREAIYSFYRKP